MTQSKVESQIHLTSMRRVGRITRSRISQITQWIFLVAVLLTAGRMASQVNAATLHGFVSDPSGAAIPGVTITVTNVDTGIKRISQTDNAGQYTVPSLQPGLYTVLAAAQGFSATRQDNFKLDVGQVAGLDLSLKIGAAADTVTVSTTASSLVDTETTLGVVIPEQQVQDLPLNGRQFSQLLVLSPGVVPIDNSQNAGKAPNFGAGAISPSVNGQSNRSNTYFVDGIIDSDPFFGGFSFSPSVDDIQEFKEQSHTDQAEYGLSTGAITSVITRPGGNTFHGSVFEFLRNTSLNTTPEFFTTKNPYHLNQFGGSLGGPILKNKFFFFANYEGGRQSIAGKNLGIVPTVAERGGDFSGVLPGGKTTTLYDPATFNPVTFTEKTFTANNISTRIDPKMLAFLQAVYPLPNLTPTASNPNNYTNSIGNTTIGDQGNIRLDYNLGQKDIFSGRYSQNAATISSPGGLNTLFQTGFDGKNTGGSWVHTYTPTTISEIVFAYNSLNIPQNFATPYSEAAVFTAAGLGAGWNEHPGGVSANLIPGVSLSGGSYSGTSAGFGPIGPSDIIQVAGSLSKQLGSHALKLGGSFYRTALYTNYSGNGVTFSNKATWNAACQYAGTNAAALAQCPTYNPTAGDLGGGGDPAASFLLSLPISANNSLGNSGVNLRQHILGFFVQDSWTVNRKLTVNYGLRWDYSAPVTDTDNRLSAYNIYTHKYFVAAGDVDLPSTPLPSYVQVGPRNTVTKPYYTYFQPRLGVSYRLFEHTILRAGAGRDFDLFGLPLQVAQQARGGWPSGYTQIASTQNLNFAGISNLAGTNTPVSGEEPFSGPGVLPAAPLPAGGLGFQDANWQAASSVQWNFAVEQNLGKGGVFTLGYVGSHSEHETVALPYNVAQPSTNPIKTYPDQVLGSPGTDETSIGSLNYESLQASYRRTITQGFVLNTSFTLARTFGLAQCGGDFYQSCIQNPYNLKAEYGPTDLDIPIVFTLNASYKLPFGKGGQFLTSGVGAAIFGGFQLNTIVSVRSGLLLNPNNGINGDAANVGGGQQRLNFLSNPNSGAPHQKGNYFNAAAFAFPANGTYGNAGINALRGPGYVNDDLSLFRDIALRDRLKLELRLEAFDLFNHPNLGNPNVSLGNGSFNTINSTVSVTGPGSNRVAQVAAKILF